MIKGLDANCVYVCVSDYTWARGCTSVRVGAVVCVCNLLRVRGYVCLYRTSVCICAPVLVHICRQLYCAYLNECVPLVKCARMRATGRFCLCLQVYMSTYAFKCACPWVFECCTCAHISVHMCICVCVRVCDRLRVIAIVSAWMCACAFMCVHTHVCVCACICLRVYDSNWSWMLMYFACVCECMRVCLTLSLLPGVWYSACGVGQPIMQVHLTAYWIAKWCWEQYESWSLYFAFYTHIHTHARRHILTRTNTLTQPDTRIETYT